MKFVTYSIWGLTDKDWLDRTASPVPREQINANVQLSCLRQELKIKLEWIARDWGVLPNELSVFLPPTRRSHETCLKSEWTDCVVTTPPQQGLLCSMGSENNWEPAEWHRSAIRTPSAIMLVSSTLLASKDVSRLTLILLHSWTVHWPDRLTQVAEGAFNRPNSSRNCHLPT